MRAYVRTRAHRVGTASPRTGWRVAAAAAAIVVGLLAAPGAAPAATSCAFNGSTGFLTVELAAANDLAQLIVAPNAEIVVGSHQGQVPCPGAGGPPAANTTDSILIANRPGATGTAVQIVGASRFGPGVSGEGGGTREIEIFVNLNNEPGSQLFVEDDNATIRFGTQGINPNAFAFEVAPDADIFYAGVRGLVGLGDPDPNNTGPDVLDAQGGAGTGGPLADPVFLAGNGGADILTGGDGPDILVGGDGNDHLEGRGGDDTFLYSAGDDDMDGGPGTDVASYLYDGTSVSVDLGIAGPQPTGAGNDSLVNIENLIGTPGADVLRGDGGPNELLGNSGADVLDGRGGEDVLDGGKDADFLDVRDGGPDTADCGSEADTATADRPGLDTLSNCEMVLFPPAVGGRGTGATSTSGTLGSTDADRFAPSFLGRVKADPARFEARGRGRRASAAEGTTFRYSLSEPAAVTFAIERRMSGRRVKGTCRARTRSNTGRPSCTRFGRVGSFRARAGVGANATPFSGRMAGKPLRPGAYRALVGAVDAAGNRSRRATASFTVLRARTRGRGH